MEPAAPFTTQSVDTQDSDPKITASSGGLCHAQRADDQDDRLDTGTTHTEAHTIEFIHY